MRDELIHTRKTDDLVRTSRAERDALLPTLNDPYKAAGIADSNELPGLAVIMGKDGFKPGEAAYWFLPYVHMGVGTFGFTKNGQVFRCPFSDLQSKLLTVEGRNLLRTCDYIRLRRLPWIRMADRDFRPGGGVADDEPIITRIEVTDWQPKPLAVQGGGSRVEAMELIRALLPVAAG